MRRSTNGHPASARHRHAGPNTTGILRVHGGIFAGAGLAVRVTEKEAAS
jgi:hypothetical protein